MIPLARYRFHCRATSPIIFPRYAGSAWRGAFGHALKHTVCVTRLRNCCQCLLWRSCAYSYLFETPPPQGASMLRKYPAAPHPFLIHPEATNARRYAAGEEFSADLTLIGRANAQLPYVIHAWRKMGQTGIGAGRGRFTLEAVSQLVSSEGWQEVYRDGGTLAAQPPLVPPAISRPEGRCALVLETPVRIQHRERLMGVEEFSFQGLLAALLRRLSLLSYFHGPGPLQADFRTLVDQAGGVRALETDLVWYDWERYSNRQQTRMRMGGLLGRVVFDSHALAPFWPWLAAGQAVHVGKGTVMGLGRYRIEAVSSPEDNASSRVETL